MPIEVYTKNINPLVEPIGRDATHAAIGDMAKNSAESNRGSVNRTDTVNITESVTSLKQAEASLAAVPVVDDVRVEEIKASINNGTYKIDAHKLASNLIDKEFSSLK
jgi:negative regulator of flagellin synthesis FlgM